MARKASAWRGFAACALGAGVVVAGVGIGAPEAREARAEHRPAYWAEGEMPQSPGAMEYPVGEGVAVNGVQIRMTYFLVAMDPDALRDHYLRALDARGLAPQVQQGADGGWTVIALTEDGRAEIVVAIFGQGPRRSLVFPSLVPLGATSGEAAQKLLEALPLSPSAMGALTATSSDRPGEAVITYHEPERPAGATAGFIGDELGKRGWRLLGQAGPAAGPSAWTIEAQRGALRARFTVTAWPRADAGATVAVHLRRDE